MAGTCKKYGHNINDSCKIDYRTCSYQEENSMNQTRIDRVLDVLKDMGISQMLITDPMSIYYLTDVYVHPGERVYALYLRADGNHIFFLNK